MSGSLSGRYGGSLSGNVVGAILVIGGIALLIWNERNAGSLESAMSAGSKEATRVSIDNIDSSNEGKLIYITGQAKASNDLADPDFGIRASNALKLMRKVEVYEWVESKDDDDEDNSVQYYTEWRDRLIDSNRFWNKGKHKNPSSLRFDTRYFFADTISVGKFELGDSMIASLKESDRVPVDQDKVTTGLPAARLGPLNLRDNYIYLAEKIFSPKVGDLRISFWTTPAGEVSAVGKQQGNKIVAFSQPNGTTIDLIAPGVVPSDSLFKQAEPKNRFSHWLFRALAMIMLILGLRMLKHAITFLSEKATVLNLATASETFALALALAVSGACWLTAEPTLGGGLLAGACVLLVVSHFVARMAQDGPSA